MKKLHLDIHQHVDGLTAEAVAGAHAKDLETQARYGVKYLKYGTLKAPAKSSA